MTEMRRRMEADIQELLGHKNIRTTMLYTRVSPRALSKVVSPLDRLDWRAPDLK